MAAKNWRGKRHPGLIWRVLFGHNRPTRARLEKALRVKLTDTFVVPYRDETGRVRKQVWRIEPDGTTRQVQQQPKKKTAAKKPPGKRGVSKPSKPSKTGSTQRQRTTPAATPVRPVKAAPMTERYLQNPDGTMAGSRKQKPITYEQAQREYAKAAKNAAAASKRAEQLLGWDQKRGQ